MLFLHVHDFTHYVIRLKGQACSGSERSQFLLQLRNRPTMLFYLLFIYGFCKSCLTQSLHVHFVNTRSVLTPTSRLTFERDYLMCVASQLEQDLHLWIKVYKYLFCSKMSAGVSRWDSYSSAGSCRDFEAALKLTSGPSTRWTPLKTLYGEQSWIP